MSRAAEASPALRLWPGAVLLALLGISRLGVRNALEGFEGFSLAIQGTLGAGALIVLWWLFLSRAPWLERLGALAVLVGGLAASYFLRHESMGPHWLAVYAVPTACAALVIGALASRGREPAARRLVMAALLVLTAGGWTLLRTTGIDGNHAADFQWRWSPTAEAQMLTDGNLEPAIAAPREAAEDPALAAAAQWPGFRGAARDGVVRGLEIETDWQASPPRELWRRPVGPGWSSFAVLGDRIFTHEQRGEEETVSAYRLDSGEPVWRHADPVRFFESNAGAGPRATPAVAEGRVFSYGATGILNALDAATGAVLWSRDVAAEAEAKLPSWGFSSSPLVTDGLVIVDARGLFAYDVATGEPRWRGPSGAVHYTSPQIFTVDGVRQVVFTGGEETVGLAIDDGSRLWGYEWPGFTMVQPAQAEDGDLLVGAGAGVGLRRFSARRAADGWKVEERWASIRMKPYFNDFVIHGGYAYGFDDSILAAVDLADGSRAWKGGRYGNGQLLLLADQDLLLVVTERGELALVEASPGGFREVALVQGIEGKTWNHPVLAGDGGKIVLLRNAQEMAAFRL